MATYTGTNSNDVIIAGNGGDTLYGQGGNDTLVGGNSGDILIGGDGNDLLDGRNGNDHLAGGAGDDVIDGGNGFDTAYYSDDIGKYSFLASAGFLHIRHLGGSGPDGHDIVIRVERLVFADRVIELGSGKNRPVAMDDFVSVTEDSGTYSSGAAGVLANDYDFDGDAMTVTAGTFVGAYGTLTLNSNGTYTYTLSAAAQALGLGDSAQDSFNYTVKDNDGTDTGTLVFTIAGRNDAPDAVHDSASTGENEVAAIDVLANDTDVDNGAVLTVTAASAPVGQGSASVVGNQVQYDPGSDFESLAEGESADVTVSYSITDEHGATDNSTVTVTVTGANDGPVANPDTGSTSENAVLTIDAAANDTDVDNGAVLAVTAASAPAGKGSAAAVDGKVEFDPGTDFDHLAVGESEIVVVGYTVEDEHGASSSSTVTITVTGTNDGPVANPDTRTTSENSAVVIDVLGNDVDVDHEAVLVVTAASVPAGQGSVTIVENQVRFDPGDDFVGLASGESAVVVISYTIEDEYGASSSSTVTVTVQGREPGTSTTGTNEGETLIGTPGDDTLDALGGDDSVFGRGGDDIIFGGDGNDNLDGEEDNDVVDGGNGDDIMAGGQGDDQLLGQAGGDIAFGGDGADQLSGGAGFDQLYGEAGDDVLDGGGDDDNLDGGEGDDQLSGGTGNDGLAGGEGNDVLAGGDGSDFLADFNGTNSFAGGAGNDHILASSSDGAQTIDGGDGNDTIRHYYRSSASTITTGSGIDTIEIAHADVGTEAIVVTDFTAGAGGDKFRLSGDDGSLLSLLQGWDGSSNPFGSGFLRLQQDGSDTLLQWDRDGSEGGFDWETLAVFQGSDADEFTGDNFEPGYSPDGSAPAGETINGTADDDVLTGTIGADTINGLDGNDFVNGGSGADQINGGDGADTLNGESDGDVVDGGNGDDSLSGGNGNDQLYGQSGNDNLDGGDGDDQMFGGDGNDTLIDFAGTNSFSGGIGQDFIIAGSSDGPQTIDGGDGDDTIRHYYRSSASIITTGAGSDTIELAYADVGTEVITVTDFTAGSGGDRLRLTGDGSLLGLLQGWDGSSNPFGSGFLRLRQDGADTLFQWDRDGTEGGSDWETLIVFQNTDAGDFTEANFVPGYGPGGGEPAGETINGTAEDDVLFGTVGADTINGLGGNDFVLGAAGGDQINGGDGFDQLFGEAGDDTIAGGADDDQASGGEGADSLSGEGGDDALFGDEGADQLSGGLGDDDLDGGGGDDSILGGDGSDYLTGGLGLDVLTGGAGADDFAFRNASSGADQVTDFVGGTDRILVSADGFGGGLNPGGSVSLVSGSDPVATGTSGQFLYDTDNGQLLWDVDGVGGEDAVLVATFTNLPTLTPADFIVGG